MNLEFFSGLIIGALVAGGALALAVARLRHGHGPAPEIADWTPAAYEPQRVTPQRAVTRLTINDLTWEIH